MMNLASMDPALACSGLMSNFSYDSHPVSRRRTEDKLPRLTSDSMPDSYTVHQMDLEIQRVAREMYKAFSGMNEEFVDPKEQIVIDKLSSHTDTGRKELIHPYKTLYGRSLNYVLKDNLGDSWEEACATLMCEMRMYELECLRRRMEDEVAAVQAAEEALETKQASENNSLLSPGLSSIKSPTSTGSARKKRNGTAGQNMKLEDMLAECTIVEEEQKFTGHSCLLITWKTNPEVEKFKELYMEQSVKTHKRKSKHLVDPGDLVSEKSLQKVYTILGKGEGTERLLIKGKKPDQVEEVDGDCFRYFLLAGTTHPYPDDTFYSVGRVPRKLLMKYLGIKMYLVRLKEPPPPIPDWKHCFDITQLAMASAGIVSPQPSRNIQQDREGS